MERRGRDTGAIVMDNPQFVPSAFLFRGAWLLGVVRCRQRTTTTSFFTVQISSVDCKVRDTTEPDSSVYQTPHNSSRLSADYIYMQTMERRGRDMLLLVYLHKCNLVPSAFLYREAWLLGFVRCSQRTDGVSFFQHSSCRPLTAKLETRHGGGRLIRHTAYRRASLETTFLYNFERDAEGTLVDSCIYTKDATSLPRFCIEELGSSGL